MKTPHGILVVVAVIAFTAAVVQTWGENADGRNEKIVLTEKPTTINVELTDEMNAESRRQISSGSFDTLRLRISGVELPENHLAIESLRVFIGKEDASEKTSIKDEHYVSSIVFGLQKKQTFLLNIARVIERLHLAEKILDQSKIPVTIVPIFKETRIPISNVTIEFPEQNK